MEIANGGSDYCLFWSRAKSGKVMFCKYMNMRELQKQAFLPCSILERVGKGIIDYQRVTETDLPTFHRGNSGSRNFEHRTVETIGGSSGSRNFRHRTVELIRKPKLQNGRRRRRLMAIPQERSIINLSEDFTEDWEGADVDCGFDVVGDVVDDGFGDFVAVCAMKRHKQGIGERALQEFLNM